MKKVLTTGGSGFIGHWLEGESAPSYTLMNIANRSNYPHILERDRLPNVAIWDYIIHLAPVPIDRVIECAKRCGATVLLASSGGVYDRDPAPYFKMKLEDEAKLRDSKLDYRIARIFTTCGAHMKWERYAIGNFIMQAERGEPIRVQSYGSVVRSYMYGSDLAEWLWAILLRGQPGGVYDVGAEEPHSTKELAWEIAGNYDPPPQINVAQTWQHEPRPHYIPDISRARDELGLSIKVPFGEAVARTVEDYRDEHRNHDPLT